MYNRIRIGIAFAFVLTLVVTVVAVNLSYAALPKSSTTLISKLTPSTYGQSVSLVATVKPSPTNGEQISFYDSGVLIGSAPIASGSATFTISALAAGTHQITASYPGDALLAPSNSSALTQTVRKVTTSTLLTTSQATSTYGQPVTFSVRVPANVPNGELVAIYDGPTQIGSGTTSSSSTSVIISTLNAGLHSISAVYLGDGNYTASTSNTLAQTVQPAFTTTALNSTLVAGSVVLSASVRSAYGPAPNGEIVTFKDGTKTLNSTKVESGVATYTSAALASGTHKITATYQGDTNLIQSTSQVLTLVNGVATNGTVSSGCGFAVNVSSDSQKYVVPQKIGIFYTVKSLGGCTLQAATGTLTLSGASGGVYASVPINITSIISTPVARVVYINSTNAAEGPNLADVLISAGSISNLSTTSFYVLHTANLSIRNASLVVGNATQVGAPLYIAGSVLNNAFTSAVNASVNLKIIAPDLSTFYASEWIGKIKPFQNLSIFLNPGIGAVPQLQGKYLVVENISFYSNYSTGTFTYSSNVLHSNTTSFQYTAYVNKNSGYNATRGYPGPVAQIGSAVVESLPYYTALPSIAQSDIGDISFYNSAQYPITVNLTSPSLAFGSIAFSQNSVTLLPGRMTRLDTKFLPFKNVNYGTYIVPINTVVSSLNGTSSGQLSLILVLKNNPPIPQLFSKITLLNGSRSSSTNLTIQNPTGSAYYSMYLSTALNSSVTNSINSITVNGPYAEAIPGNGIYSLRWRIDRLAPHNSTSLSYNITNVTQVMSLLVPQISMFSTTQSNLTALSILSIHAPVPTYVNNTYNITVSAVYTGVNDTTINFTLSPTTAFGKVLNPQQSFKVAPESTIFARFAVSTGSYPTNETFSLQTPGLFTIPSQKITIDVQLPPVQIVTISQYLSDPRTIFGILTLILYIATISYKRVITMYRDRKLKKHSTVKSFEGLTKLAKNINIGILEEDHRKRTFRRQINKDRSLGGFVEDTAIAGKDVIVASKAIIEGGAVVSGDTKVIGTARVSGSAVIRGEVTISQNAKVGDNAEVYGKVTLSGNAKAFGNCEIYDEARIEGNAEIFGDARVYGHAKISGSAKVYGNADISGIARVSKGSIKRGERV